MVRITDAAEVEVNRNGWAVTIAIVDAGGHLLALNRLDGAAPVSASTSAKSENVHAIGQAGEAAYRDWTRC